MFLSIRQCAEHMTLLRRLKVKVTFLGHVIYPSIRIPSIPPNFLFIELQFNFTQMLLTVRQCVEHMTQLPRLNVKDPDKVKGLIIKFVYATYRLKPFVRFSLTFTQGDFILLFSSVLLLGTRQSRNQIYWNICAGLPQLTLSQRFCGQNNYMTCFGEPSGSVKECLTRD